MESCGFRDKAEAFAKLDTVVIGASTDTLAEQAKFTKKEKLTFPLLADDAKAVSKAYGVLGKTGRASRHTFVIDKEGTLRKVYTQVAPAKHPQEVLDFVKQELAK